MCVRVCVSTFRLCCMLPICGAKSQYQVLGFKLKPKTAETEKFAHFLLNISDFSH